MMDQFQQLQKAKSDLEMVERDLMGGRFQMTKEQVEESALDIRKEMMKGSFSPGSKEGEGEHEALRDAYLMAKISLEDFIRSREGQPQIRGSAREENKPPEELGRRGSGVITEFDQRYREEINERPKDKKTLAREKKEEKKRLEAEKKRLAAEKKAQEKAAREEKKRQEAEKKAQEKAAREEKKRLAAEKKAQEKAAREEQKRQAAEKKAQEKAAREEQKRQEKRRQEELKRAAREREEENERIKQSRRQDLRRKKDLLNGKQKSVEEAQKESTTYEQIERLLEEGFDKATVTMLKSIADENPDYTYGDVMRIYERRTSGQQEEKSSRQTEEKNSRPAEKEGRQQQAKQQQAKQQGKAREPRAYEGLRNYKGMLLESEYARYKRVADENPDATFEEVAEIVQYGEIKSTRREAERQAEEQEQQRAERGPNLTINDPEACVAWARTVFDSLAEAGLDLGKAVFENQLAQLTNELNSDGTMSQEELNKAVNERLTAMLPDMIMDYALNERGRNRLVASARDLQTEAANMGLTDAVEVERYILDHRLGDLKQAFEEYPAVIEVENHELFDSFPAAGTLEAEAQWALPLIGKTLSDLPKSDSEKQGWKDNNVIESEVRQNAQTYPIPSEEEMGQFEAAFRENEARMEALSIRLQSMGEQPDETLMRDWHQSEVEHKSKSIQELFRKAGRELAPEETRRIAYRQIVTVEDPEMLQTLEELNNLIPENSDQLQGVEKCEPSHAEEKNNGDIDVETEMKRSQIADPKRNRKGYANACWSISLSMLLRAQGVEMDFENILKFRPKLRKEVIGNITKLKRAVTFYGELNKDRQQSIIELADIVMKCLPNTAVYTVDIPEHSKPEEVLQEIRSALEKGSPVSVLLSGHYRTIVGIRGTVLQLKNSLSDPDDPEHIETKDVRDLITDISLNRKKPQMQLVWLEKLKPDENGNLRPDERVNIQYENGVPKDMDEGDQKEAEIGHNEGILMPVREERKGGDVTWKKRAYFPKSLVPLQEDQENQENQTGPGGPEGAEGPEGE